jgi:hypothetical protein
LLSAYAEQFVGYLNGDRPDEPKNCLPHSGSSLHLHEYATAYGCKGDGGVNWRSCVFAKLEKPLAALQGSLNPALNSSALLKERLDRAVGTCSGSSGGGEGARTVVSPTARNHSGCNARFTFIPAAVVSPVIESERRYWSLRGKAAQTATNFNEMCIGRVLYEV